MSGLGPDEGGGPISQGSPVVEILYQLDHRLTDP